MKYFIFIMFLYNAAANAGNGYKCSINNVAEPQTNGKLREVGDTSVVGKVFTVDRKSGNMAGVIKNNYLTAPIVFDYGSNENSFNAITTQQNNIASNVRVIIIEEFSKSTNKPFIYLTNLLVYHGTCIHF